MSLKSDFIEFFVEESASLADVCVDALSDAKPGDDVCITLSIRYTVPERPADKLLDEISELEEAVAPQGTCFHTDEPITNDIQLATELIRCLRQIMLPNSSVNTPTNSPQPLPAEATFGRNCPPRRQ